MQLPVYPDDATREAHHVHHLPYSSWCKWCVRGRGREDKHRRQGAERERSIPVISPDYFCMSKDEEDVVATVLVLSLWPYGATRESQVPAKGGSGYATESVIQYMELWGVTECIMKSNQEVALQALVTEVKQRWPHRISVELSPKGSHQSNGPAESQAQRVEGLVRTLIARLEDQSHTKIGAASLILPWALRHAAFLLRGSC